MGGWKTWIAALAAGLATALDGLGIGTEFVNLLWGVASAFGLVGLGHKIDKLK